MKMIDCILPFAGRDQVAPTLDVLRNEPLVREVIGASHPLGSTVFWKSVAASLTAPYTLVYTKYTPLRLGQFSLERMLAVAKDTGAVMVYSDHFKEQEGERIPAPVIDYQEGALRDQFDFGSVLLYRTEALLKAVEEMDADYQYAALYDLRLRVSRLGSFVHIGEFLYYEVETDTRKSGEKLFDYVDPKNRAVQIEMEQAVTAHLKAVGAYLEPVFREVDLSEGEFPVEATVVIPCKNRVRTIGDALRSALSQKTDFPYNVIVVDDNSDDGTVEVIQSFLGDPHLIYIAQDKTYHAIGGNWNAAIHHPACGRYALQLDSDDVYSGPDTVQKFVEAFRSQQCAMVVGSYQMTDFDMNPLPPGVINHREWTPDNGRNNALRVNGFGAPRGFFVPLLRQLNFPVTKYGEDYAVALRISREYRIGRIYDVLYNCRRWDNNSDGNLPIEKVNANDHYKDWLRTVELRARIRMSESSVNL